MEDKRLRRLLAAEAAVCVAAVAALHMIEGAAFSLYELPAGALGRGLTALAGTGRLGFALALTLYAALVLLPVYALTRIAARRALRAEDALLGGTSLAAAAALLPAGLLRYWSTETQQLFTRLSWQWLAFALLAGWVVLRLLRRFSEGQTEKLLRLLRVLLGAAAAYFVFSVCFSGLAGLLTAVDRLAGGNTALTGGGIFDTGADTDISGSLPLSYAFLALRYIVGSVPALLAAATALLARDLLDSMEDGHFTARSAEDAPKLADWCVRALRLTVLASLAVNILQAVCRTWLLNVSISIKLPLFELCFVLASLLGARLIAANVALKSESDLII